MLATALAFAALTALFAVWHVRARARGAGEAPACPRCGARTEAGATFCGACGVPLQAYELVTAPVVDAARARAEGGAAHALVRADLCVGCGSCVGVCPEPGAIRVADHRAHVDLDRCKGHAACAAACPVGAIVITTGAAAQRVEAPQVDAHFESNVPGLYVVGELGGRGLIKNAVNEGRIAIEHVAEVLPPGQPRPDGDALAWDVVIVGSGPAGLSAGLEAQRLGLRYLVLEQGTISDTIRKYPRRKLLLAEPARVQLYGGLWVADASKEELLRVWETIIARSQLRIHTGERVEAVERRGAFFEVRSASGAYRARRVVLAMGRRGTPRRLGVPGEELDKALYDIVEMEAFAGQRMLVVGGGDSAVESALGLANQPGTTVTLCHRGTDLARVKERNRAKLDAALAAGRLELLIESRVAEIRPAVAVLDCAGMPRLLPNDYVIVRIGGEAPYPFLERCGVRIVTKEVALDAAAERSAG